MFRSLLAPAAAFSFAALSPVFAQTAAPTLKGVEAQTSGASALSEKTSDRTLDNLLLTARRALASPARSAPKLRGPLSIRPTGPPAITTAIPRIDDCRLSPCHR